MAITVFTNAFLIDCTGKDPVEGAAVVVEGERIKDVIASGKVGPLPGKIDTVDLKGRTLMPGLTDAHVHVCAVEGNIPEQHRHNPPSLIAAKTTASGRRPSPDSTRAPACWSPAGRSRRPAATPTSGAARSGSSRWTAAWAWRA